MKYWLLLLTFICSCGATPTITDIAPITEDVLVSVSTYESLALRPLWQRVVLWLGVASVIAIIFLGERKKK